MFTPGLVLSTFHGADLLGRGFEAAGFHVVRGPEKLLGLPVEDYTPPHGVFEGVIGGPPCQDFSALRRTPPTGDGVRLIREFLRVVHQSGALWFLMENVPRVPGVCLEGYTIQRFNLTAQDCGLPQLRNRKFQFGTRDGTKLVVHRELTPPGASQPACIASEARRPGARTFAQFCATQGLPESFDLPGLPTGLKYQLVGNGVPVPVAKAVAMAIRHRTAAPIRLCACDCGRVVTGRAFTATAACRQRQHRQFETASERRVVEWRPPAPTATPPIPAATSAEVPSGDGAHRQTCRVDLAEASAGFVGSKERMARVILNQIPPHELYAEPFLGLGAVLRAKRPATTSVGVEKDAATAALWRTVAIPGLRVVHGCGVAWMKSHPFTGGEVIYCDPPYPASVRSSARRYYAEEMMEDEQHAELLGVIGRLPCRVIVSGYDCPLYVDRLRGWRKMEISVMTRGGTPALECLWFNYAEPTALHEYTFLGDNFRERQDLNRMKARMIAKLAKMPLLKQKAMLAALEDWKSSPSSSSPSLPPAA
jgi:DNA (cytosine-5)-methyltransferase 1